MKKSAVLYAASLLVFGAGLFLAIDRGRRMEPRPAGGLRGRARSPPCSP